MGNSSVAFVGRVLFAIIFIGSGISKFTEWDQKTGGPIAQLMNPKLESFIAKTGLAAQLPKDYATHFPYIVLAAGATELLGSFLLIANAPVGACLLMSFLLVTSVIVHDFWNLPPGHAQMNDMIQFLKNLALIGGCLMYLGMKRSSNGSKKKLD